MHAWNRSTRARPRPGQAHHQRDSRRRQGRWRRGADRVGSAGRRGALPRGSLSVGPERGHRHAVRVDPQSLSGLHPRLPLLLCPSVPLAVRTGGRRRLRIGDLREDQLRRGLETRVAATVVASRVGGAGLCHGLLPADRRSVQDHARRARGAARCGQPDSHRHQGPYGRPRSRRARRSVVTRGVQRLHERAVRGRGCLAIARARHRASDAAAEGRARTDRGGHSRQRVDGAARARDLVEAVAHRAYGQGRRRSWRARRRLQRDAPRRRNPGPLHAMACARAPGARGGVRKAVRGQDASAPYREALTTIVRAIRRRVASGTIDGTRMGGACATTPLPPSPPMASVPKS